MLLISQVLFRHISGLYFAVELVRSAGSRFQVIRKTFTEPTQKSKSLFRMIRTFTTGSTWRRNESPFKGFRQEFVGLASVTVTGLDLPSTRWWPAANSKHQLSSDVIIWIPVQLLHLIVKQNPCRTVQTQFRTGLC